MILRYTQALPTLGLFGVKMIQMPFSLLVANFIFEGFSRNLEPILRPQRLQTKHWRRM
jgi:hypothetical protein